jgi:DNA-binding transcriptional MocR family regulator
MELTIDRDSRTPFYMQIYAQIRGQILSGALIPGYRLPPERKLAERLLVNRTTVLGAYRELKAEGLIEARVGNGTVVCAVPDTSPDGRGDAAKEPAWNQIFSRYSGRFDSGLLGELLELANRTDVISFATGIASPESGPREALEGIEREIASGKDDQALLHTPTQGLASMREAVRGLMQRRGLTCQTDEIMMLSGSQQGIDLAARVLVDPGDLVVVEEPTYFPAITVFKTAGARVIGVPVDDGGMRIDVLEQLLSRYRPKLIYTVPTFQNPTGTELRPERRKRLVELAYRHHVLLLEDDAYGDLCYEGNLLPTLKSFDSDGYVIYLSTFSKNIYSGLRLGWIIAHKRIIKEFSAVKQLMDLHPNSLSQWIVERFIRTGNLEAHVKKICGEYQRKRDLMADALSRHAPQGMTWNLPRGGYYIWCGLPEGVSANRLIAKAAEYKVAFVPGSPFYVSGEPEDHIRLNFTFAPISEIDEGIRRLCAAIGELMNEKHSGRKATATEIKPVV